MASWSRPRIPRVVHGVEYLETHLRRLYGIDECSGLLEIIVEVHPEFSHEAHRIQSERDAIRAEAHRLALALENPHSPTDESLHVLMKELRKLIASILLHEHHERAILIDSANVDRGGEA